MSCMPKSMWKTELISKWNSDRSFTFKHLFTLCCTLTQLDVLLFSICLNISFSPFHFSSGCRWLQTGWWSTLFQRGWWSESGTESSCTALWWTHCSERTLQVKTRYTGKPAAYAKTKLLTCCDHIGSCCPEPICQCPPIIFWLWLELQWRQSWVFNNSNNKFLKRGIRQLALCLAAALFMCTKLCVFQVLWQWLHSFWPWIKSSPSSQICTGLTNNTAQGSSHVTADHVYQHVDSSY